MFSRVKKGQSVNSEDGIVKVVSSKNGVVEYKTQRNTTVSTAKKNVTPVKRRLGD